MAEKKYYWIKLTEQFFTDKPIKKLRKLAGGDTFTIIYLKMLLKAVTQNNKLYFEGVEDDFAEELALELDEDKENVSVTIAYLKSKGLLKLVSEDEMLLLQCDEMVGSETDAARRKRLQRERERARGIKGPRQPETLPAPKKETQVQLFRRLTEGDDYLLSDQVKEKLTVWFTYKTERKESYKEQGMKSLLRQVEKNCQKHGDEAVMELIEVCMSGNWKGIIWDKLEKGGQKPKENASNKNAYPHRQYDFDQIQRQLIENMS